MQRVTKFCLCRVRQFNKHSVFIIYDRRIVYVGLTQNNLRMRF